MSFEKVDAIDSAVLENAKLCAKQGWRADYEFLSGEVFEKAFITATDFDRGAVVLERVGERHLKPRLVHLSELKSLKPDWS